MEVLEYRAKTYAPPGTPFVHRYDTFRAYEWEPRLMSQFSFGQLGSHLYYTLACARKRADSTRDRAPTQWVFKNFA